MDTKTPALPWTHPCSDIDPLAVDELQAGVRILTYYVDVEGSCADWELVALNLKTLSRVAGRVYGDDVPTPKEA